MSRRLRPGCRLLGAAATVVAVTALAAGAAAMVTQFPGEEILADADRPISEVDRPMVEIDRPVRPFDGRVSRRDGDQLVVSLDADIFFEFDQATLTPEAEASLRELADEIDDTLDGDTVTVVGHTDARGDDDYNLDLSRRRAEAVRDFLAPLLRTSPTFEVEGRGEAEPVAPNETADGADDPDGRRRNRRVEITYDATPPDDTA